MTFPFSPLQHLLSIFPQPFPILSTCIIRYRYKGIFIDPQLAALSPDSKHKFSYCIDFVKISLIILPGTPFLCHWGPSCMLWSSRKLVLAMPKQGRIFPIPSFFLPLILCALLCPALCIILLHRYSFQPPKNFLKSTSPLFISIHSVSRISLAQFKWPPSKYLLVSK